MKKNLLCVVFCFLSTLITLHAAAVNWVDSKRNADVAYFLHNSTPRIESYDLTTESWKTVITLSQIPTAFHIDDAYLYIAYDKAVYRYTYDGTNETHLGNFDHTVHGLFSEGDILFVNHSESYYAYLNSVNRHTAAQIDSTSDYIDAVLYASHSPENNKIYGTRHSGSPQDINVTSYNDDGTFIGTTDSPHHGAYSIGTHTWVWPGGSKVADASGNVYDGITLNHRNSFATQIDDLDFHGADIPIVLSGNRLSAFSKSVLETGYKELQVTPQHIHVKGNKVATFYPDDTSSNGMGVLFVGLDELSADTPGLPVSPTDLAFTPDDAFIGNDGILYLFSKTHESLFRWDVSNQQWQTAIPLLGSPEHAKYSPATNTVYTDYAGGRIFSIDLADSEPSETAFFNLSNTALGFATAGEFLIVIDGSRDTTSIDSTGTVVQTAYKTWNSHFKDATWSSDNQTLYHFRDGSSPNDLIKDVINIDGTFGEHADGPYHSSAGIQYPIRLNDDGTVLLLGSGRFYNPSTLEQVNTLPETLVDAAWVNGELFTIHDSSTVKAWTSPTYGAGAVHTFQGTAHRIFAISNTRFLLVYLDTDGVPRVSIYDTSYDLIPPAVLETPILSLIRNSASAASLDWTNIAGEEAFILERKTGTGGTWAELTTTGMDLTGFVDSTVTTGNVYYYRVKADNDGLESSYSNEVKVDLVYDPIDATPIPAPSVAFTADDMFIGNGNILYLLSKAHDSLFRWDIDTQSWLSTIALRGAPDYITYSEINHAVYTVYNNGSIYEINLQGSPLVEVAFANLATSPRGLIAAGEFLIGADNSGAWESHTSFAVDGSKIDYDDWNRPFKQAAWSEVTRRIYHFRDGTSPNDLHYEEINQDGSFGAQGETPYHSSVGITYPIRVKPDGTIVLLGSGRIYDANSLALLNTLPNTINDATWLNGELYTLSGGVITQYGGPTYAPGSTVALHGTGERILATIDQRLLAVSTGADGRPRINVYNADYSLSSPTALAAPVAFLGSSSTSSITISWTDVGGESEYRIERRNNSTDPWVQVGTTNADITTYSDSTVTIGNSYSYRIHAARNLLNSPHSNEIDVSLVIPNQVTNFNVVADSARQISLSWGDVQDETGYRIYRSTDNAYYQFVATSPVDSVAFVDSVGLSEGITYFYKVVAFNGVGNAPESDVKAVTTPIDPPVAPAVITASPVGALRVDISWSNVASETGFILERATTPVSNNRELVQTAGDNVVSYSDLSVRPETEYVYRVFARNLGGDSASTVSSPVRSGALTTPLQPNSISAIREDTNTVRLSWLTVLDVQNYTIFRRLQGNSVWDELAVVDGGVGIYYDNTISIGKSYEYTISASNDSGVSAQASPTLIDIKVEYFLLVDDFDSGSLSESWSDIDGGSFLSGAQEGSQYILYFSQTGSRSAATQELNVSEGGRIIFEIRAGNQSVDGWNNSESGEDIVLEYSKGGSQWIQMQSLGGVYPSLSGWTSFAIDIPEVARSENTQFRWRQRSHSGSNYDVWALEGIKITSYALPDEIPVPEAPGYLITDSTSASSITLLWQLVSSATSYTIERQESGGSWEVVKELSGLSNFYIDTDLTSSSLYIYRVFASNLGGDSAYSTTSIESTWSRVAEWRFENFGTTEATAESELNAIGADGVSNLLKFAFNLKKNQSHPWDQGLKNGMPKIVMDQDGYLKIQYMRMKSSSGSGITYEVQYSNDLADWYPLVAPESLSAIDDAWEVVTCKDTENLANRAHRFLRVKVVEE